MSTAEARMTKSAAIRARLKHPIIDSDGHIAEFEPAFFDYLKEAGGARLVERFKAMDGPYRFGWYTLTPEERLRTRKPRPGWWLHPTRNALDRAASSMPRLLHRRLDQMGLDFTIIYPSIGMFALHLGDEEMRRAACRAFNSLQADIFREYADRMTPVATVPMHTPQEAIEELEHVVKTLRLKAVLMPAFVRRPIPALAEEHPQASRWAFWLDTFGIDSAYDYDPVWAKCLELRVAPSFHSPTAGMGMRASLSNSMYNHIGHFAASNEAVCKSLFLGGVTRRFPNLRFAFLEGGVGWACTLLGELVGHWEKHNLEALANVDPASLDREEIGRLLREYGGDYGSERIERWERERSHLLWGGPEERANLDEWARAGIVRKEDIRELFVPKFYFGCEGDDRMTALAFDTKKNAFGARLNAIYSSDLGHWDLPNMCDAAAEAWELVERELLSEDDFRDFVFANAVRAKTAVNPDFFKGTIVEGAANSLLANA
jgi:predicted TIM-barrel fold metal-dependent hydrolase